MAEASGEALGKVSSLLEKTFEFKFFHIIGITFFLLDSCLVMFYGKNILNFEYRSDIADKSLGQIILFIFLFSFLVVFFFPTLRGILTWFISKLYGTFIVYLLCLEPRAPNF